MDAGTHRVAIHRTGVAGLSAIRLVSSRQFPRHAHDQFGIGVMGFGAHRSWSGIGQVEAAAGDVIMTSPGEMHDGAPLGGPARGWSMIYLDPDLVAREVEGELAGTVEIVRPVARDADTAALVARLFAFVTAARPEPLARDEILLRTLVQALRRHGSVRPAEAGTPPAIDRALRRLEATPDLPVTLAELAALAGVGRFQLLRGFARAVGTTPHAYLVQRRVALARRLLSEGETPAAAAVRAGFADQSHMTRAFVRQLGVTPARYRAAVA